MTIVSGKQRTRRQVLGTGIRLLGEHLEDRRLLAFDPSPAEQALLEHVNRMRLAPQNELAVMFESFSPLTVRNDGGLATNLGLVAIQSAVDFFQVHGPTLADEFAELTAVPPLAWNESLINAARLHNGFMHVNNAQAHQFPPQEKSLGDRLVDAGYNLTLALENVYAYSENSLYGHAGFAVDWGNGPNGMQSPPGHRDNIMNSDVTEIGIGVMEVVVVDPFEDVGPMLITQDFGRRNNYQAQLLGVTWEDGFQDNSGSGLTGIYDQGEGFGGVTITAQSLNQIFTTTSMSAGGYQLPLPAGTYTVTAKSPNPFSPFAVERAIGNVVVGTRNVKIDFEASASNATGNGRPVATSDSAVVRPNQPTDIRVALNDVDDAIINATTVRIWTPPQHGVATVSAAGVVTYTPSPGYIGTDSFQYVVADNLGAFSAPGEATLQVVPIPGDANLDSRVDVLDLQIWQANAFRSNTVWGRADFTGDGVTDGADFHVWLTNRFAAVDMAFASIGDRAAPRAAAVDATSGAKLSSLQCPTPSTSHGTSDAAVDVSISPWRQTLSQRRAAGLSRWRYR